MNKEEILKYLKQNRMDLQNAKASILAAEHVYETYVESNKVPGIAYSPIMCYHLENNEFFQILPWKNVMALSENLYKEAIANPEVIDKEIKEHLNAEKEMDSLWKKKSAYEKLSDKDFFELIKKMEKLGSIWWSYAVLGEDHGKIIDEKIVPLIEKTRNISRAEAMSLIGILTHPKEQAIFTLERKKFFEMCIYYLSKKGNIVKDKKFLKMFEEYKREFFYVKTDFYERKVLDIESTIEDIKKEIKDKAAKDIQDEINKIDEESRKIELQKKAILKQRFSDEEEKAIEFASKIVDWHDKRKRGMMKEFYYLFDLLHEFARRKNASYSIVVDLTLNELMLIMDGKKELPKKERDKSIPLMLFIEKGHKPIIFKGTEAKEMFELCKSPVSQQASEIKGAIASLGFAKDKKIRGIVRIVRDPMKDEFNNGEILVTSMTRIEFVSIMKKAKAILTDEGGIACHAAIVSRELGVPCVIGTKIASRTLNTGDEIEIDLEKGTVKIIKKA